MLRAKRHHRRPRRAIALAAELVAAYLAVGRPLMLHWGANCEEVHKRLPGDELVAGPGVQSTRAVTIDAPVDAVWPWLAQLGQDRGGFYSYEGLENLAGCRDAQRRRDPSGMAAAQARRDRLPAPASGLRVTRFEPGRVARARELGRVRARAARPTTARG